MKKIIVLLLSFMFLTSITACSESPEKLYGYYKEINEKTKYGHIIALELSEKEIKCNAWDSSLDIEQLYKDNEFWILKGRNDFRWKNVQTLKLKIENENTLEYFWNNSSRKFVKISKEEYEHILNTSVSPN